MNSEGITLDDVINTPIIGLLRNNWRRRHVVVYNHPSDAAKVVSVGHPYDGGEPIVCVELRTEYARVINMYPDEAVYD